MDHSHEIVIVTSVSIELFKCVASAQPRRAVSFFLPKLLSIAKMTKSPDERSTILQLCGGWLLQLLRGPRDVLPLFVLSIFSARGTRDGISHTPPR